MSKVLEPSSRGYKYRIHPTKEQKEFLSKTFGCSRFVYNYFLAAAKQNYKDWEEDKTLPKPFVSNTEMSKRLTALKQHPDYEFLQAPPDTCLRKSINALETAFNNQFNKKLKAKKPKFKSKVGRQSATLTEDAFRLINDKLFIAKVKTSIKVKWTRVLPSKPKTAVISKSPTGKYYISFTVEELVQPSAGTNITGIDLGLTDFIYCSDGTSVPNPKRHLPMDKRLRRLQRRLAKAKKGSKNRKKLRIRIAKLHEKIAFQRKDFLQKLSSKLVSENQAIVVEDLAVENMLKNHKLARSIANAGWGMFRAMLEYKAKSSVKCHLLIADRYYPSTQLCSVCGEKPIPKIKLGIESWTCGTCGVTHQRDHNASKNLAGLAIQYKSVWEKAPSTTMVILPAYEKWPYATSQ